MRRTTLELARQRHESNLKRSEDQVHKVTKETLLNSQQYDKYAKAKNELAKSAKHQVADILRAQMENKKQVKQRERQE